MTDHVRLYNNVSSVQNMLTVSRLNCLYARLDSMLMIRLVSIKECIQFALKGMLVSNVDLLDGRGIPIIANHGFESASFLSKMMKERIDENHPWVTDDGVYPLSELL